MSEPLVLGFDTSAAHCAAALLCADRVVAQHAEDMGRGQAERLFPLLEELLAEGGVTWRDLTALGVGTGPGNFTGIRISVAAARGLALSLGPAVPLILQGAAPVQAWSNEQLPDLNDDFLERLAIVYRDDPLFHAALTGATGMTEPDMSDDAPTNDNFLISSRAAADILRAPQGPRIGVLELGGWDTHNGQPYRLRRLFERLSEGLLALREGLGPVWSETVVMVASEFGRTAAENGNRGTDHGTGGLAMLAGGAVRGGQVAGDWPGLSSRALFEERDVLAVNAYEAIFKALLIGHMGLDPAYAERVVFPESRALEPFTGLLRA